MVLFCLQNELTFRLFFRVSERLHQISSEEGTVGLFHAKFFNAVLGSDASEDD